MSGQLDDYAPQFPNARDCEHGKQRGKCADCDLAEALRDNALLLKVAEAAEKYAELVGYSVIEEPANYLYIAEAALDDALAEWRKG